MVLPKESDFPPGTILLVKEGYPYASIPNSATGRREVWPFGFGRKSRFPDRSINMAGSNWPVSMPFPRWLEAVEASVKELSS